MGDAVLQVPSVLECRIPSEPTGEPSELQRVRLPVVQDGVAGTVVVDRLWAGPSRFKITAGGIRLRDQGQRVAEALSFGGQVTVLGSPEETVCTIQSQAPILHLAPGSPADPDGSLTRLATEVAALLGRRRAKWTENEEAFGRRLDAADSQELFVAALAAIRDRLARVPSASLDQKDRTLRNLVDRSLSSVSSPGNRLPAIEDIL